VVSVALCGVSCALIVTNAVGAVLDCNIEQGQRTGMLYLWYYPVEWYMIDEDRGWVSCQFWNRMADPGDGSVHEFKCFSLLKYAGEGLWSYEEDLFDPGDMETAIAGWVAAKAAAQ